MFYGQSAVLGILRPIEANLRQILHVGSSEYNFLRYKHLRTPSAWIEAILPVIAAVFPKVLDERKMKAKAMHYPSNHQFTFSTLRNIISMPKYRNWPVP